MWTDLAFNLVLLMLSDNIMLLAIGNVGYLIFNFLNLQAGWIHRLDRANWPRLYRARGWLLALGAVFGFLNLAFMGMGADIWGPGTLRNGLVFTCLIVPVFLFRHYVQDRGKFPATFRRDIDLVNRAGARRPWQPYAALILAALVVAVTHHLAVFP